MQNVRAGKKTVQQNINRKVEGNMFEKAKESLTAGYAEYKSKLLIKKKTN
jgi:hypothetical protein